MVRDVQVQYIQGRGRENGRLVSQWSFREEKSGYQKIRYDRYDAKHVNIRTDLAAFPALFSI